jgi:hypothetical protein
MPLVPDYLATSIGKEKGGNSIRYERLFVAP